MPNSFQKLKTLTGWVLKIRKTQPVQVTFLVIRLTTVVGTNKKDISQSVRQVNGITYYWAACAPSHKMGFRSSAAKNGLPGEGRHEGLVRRNDVLTNGFI